METIHTESAYKAFSRKDAIKQPLEQPADMQKHRELLADSGSENNSSSLVKHFKTFVSEFHDTVSGFE